MVSILRISGIQSVLAIAISGIWGVFFIASSPIATLNCRSLKFQLDGAEKFNETLTKVLFVVPPDTELLLPHCQETNIFQISPTYWLISFTGSFSTTWQIWRQVDLKMVPLLPWPWKTSQFIFFCAPSDYLPPPLALCTKQNTSIALAECCVEEKRPSHQMLSWSPLSLGNKAHCHALYF